MIQQPRRFIVFQQKLVTVKNVNNDYGHFSMRISQALKHNIRWNKCSNFAMVKYSRVNIVKRTLRTDYHEN